MDAIWHLFDYVRNPKLIIDILLAEGGMYAYLGLFAIVFAETGLAVGFFLPGDSLLVVTGIIAAADPRLNIYIVLGVLFAASVLGDSMGYWIGRRMGAGLFTRPKSFFFHPANIAKANAFFEKNGPKTIFFARFIAFVRSFVPLVAGAAKMSYPKFLTYSVLGSFSWIFSLVLAGYFFGTLVEQSIRRFFGWEHFRLDEHIEKVVIGVVCISITPVIIEFIRNRRNRAKKVETPTTSES